MIHEERGGRAEDEKKERHKEHSDIRQSKRFQNKTSVNKRDRAPRLSSCIAFILQILSFCPSLSLSLALSLSLSFTLPRREVRRGIYSCEWNKHVCNREALCPIRRCLNVYFQSVSQSIFHANKFPLPCNVRCYPLHKRHTDYGFFEKFRRNFPPAENFVFKRATCLPSYLRIS